MTKEALKLALECLDGVWRGDYSGNAKEVITAIKEALANEALEKMAENARELGLDYEPEQDWIERERAVGYREGHQNALKQMAQPEQEPVGEIVDAIEGAFKCSFTKMLPVGTKLYTTPPQRTWVGLDEDEFVYFCAYVNHEKLSEIENVLRDKNESKN